MLEKLTAAFQKKLCSDKTLLCFESNKNDFLHPLLQFQHTISFQTFYNRNIVSVRCTHKIWLMPIICWLCQLIVCSYPNSAHISGKKKPSHIRHSCSIRDDCMQLFFFLLDIQAISTMITIHDKWLFCSSKIGLLCCLCSYSVCTIYPVSSIQPIKLFPSSKS